MRALVVVLAAFALAPGLAGCDDDTATDGGTTTTGAATSTSPAPGGVRTARVLVFFPRGEPGPDCDEVHGVPRRVRAPAVLRGAMRALLRGPTRAERRLGYGGWFSAATAGGLRSVRVRDGVARIDLRDLSRIIPNASTSCGSALLLAQLDRTATQFAGVDRAVYSVDGDVRAFYSWLQRDVPRS